MEKDDEVLFEIKEKMRRSRSSFESVLNKKHLSRHDLDDVFLELN